MTLAEAKRALSRRLVFGDEEQIRAHRFLARVEEAKSSLRECEQEHDYAATESLLTCTCLDEYLDDEDVRRAAVEEVKKEQDFAP